MDSIMAMLTEAADMDAPVRLGLLNGAEVRGFVDKDIDIDRDAVRIFSDSNKVDEAGFPTHVRTDCIVTAQYDGGDQ